MRAIKFRGRRTSDRKWIYGDLKKLEPFGFFIHGYDGEFCLNFGVDTETVGQFTGLCDKNGKEIYEGDILRWDVNNVLYVVTFESGMFYASIKECNEGMLGGFSLHRLTEYDYGKCEIVGNIHDNPELLKGGEQ